MIALTLGDVAAAVGGRLEGGADPATRVTGLSTDSRSAHAGDLFVAVVGEHRVVVDDHRGHVEGAGCQRGHGTARGAYGTAEIGIGDHP